MNVLSLFDGCSGGQQALDRLGMKVDNYYASEIDKYAIQVTMANYPNTIQLGSVVDVDVSKLPKIDLLCGGSPCQSFSFAGKRKGMSTKDNIEILTLEHYLQLRSQNFEFEGQSYLFWEYIRILSDIKKVNPNVKFLLENVMMGEKWQRILTQAIGINPIEINSSLLSAQNRRRLYWTNIGAIQHGFFDDLKCAITQPKDKGILLKDVLEKEVDKKYYLKESSFIFNRIENNHPFTPRIPNKNEKSNCLKIGGMGVDDLVLTNDRGIIQHIIPEIVSVRKFEVDILSLQKCLKKHKKFNNQEIADQLKLPKTMVEHWFRTDIYFSIPDKDIWMQLKTLLNIETNEFDESIMTFIEKESVFEKSNRVYDEDGIAPTLTSTSADERILVREVKQINPSLESEGKQPYQQNRVYDIDGISPALMQGISDLIIKYDVFGGDFRQDEGFRWRKNGKSSALTTKSSSENAKSSIPLAKILLNENQLNKFNENVDTNKANTLTLAQGRAGSSDEYMDSVSKIAKLQGVIRRLTPIECERLQTVKDNYTAHVSDSQRYKMLGNGWTIDVIAHIFSFINK